MADIGYGGAKRMKVAKEQAAATKKIDTLAKNGLSVSKGKKSNLSKSKKPASKKK